MEKRGGAPFWHATPPTGRNHGQGADMTPDRDRRDIHIWTALRAIAALAVVLFHFRAHIAYPLSTIPVIGPMIANGNLGVDMFFVLSGFVMVHVYGLAEKSAGFRYGKFLTRRLARIYPVHVITLIGAFIMLMGGAMLGLNAVSPASLYSAVPFQLVLLHGISNAEGLTLNYPSWSVSSEAFAYLCFPVFAAVYRLPIPRILIVATSVVLLYIIHDATPLASYGALRVSVEFVLGMGLCLLLAAHRHRTLGLTVMALGLIVFVVAVNMAAPSSIAILGLTGLLAGAYLADTGVVRSTLMRVFVYLGQISYSIYMVHALVEAPGFKIAQMVTGAPEDQNSLWVLLILLGVTIGAAAILYHVVERPCRELLVNWFDARDRRRAADRAR